MVKKSERTFAYWLAAVLFVVGIICYAAFAKQPPEEPLRIMFKNTGGNVLFDHKEHMSESGYGFACDECHHDLEEEGARPASCTECHNEDAEEGPNRYDALHTQCGGCHEDGGGPVECAECHGK